MNVSTSASLSGQALRNNKADALSWIHAPVEIGERSKFILPRAVQLGAATIELEKEVAESNGGNPTPSACPNNCLYVPPRLRSQVLQVCHDSCLTVHPGMGRTLQVILQRFLWPTVRSDFRAYVAACSISSRSKSGHQAPAGLLHPLPIPKRSWSHISLDFVSGLPLSRGNIVVLTVVDRFPKWLKWLVLWLIRSFKSTACQKISSWTGALCLWPGSGGSSVDY